MPRWTTEKYVLEPPGLQELSAVLADGLRTHFESVAVEVTACPDLRQRPFNLASEGISGNERIADVGGPQNMRPLPKLDRKYPIRELMDRMDMDDGLIIGAGAGPFHHVGVNAELMANLKYEKGALNNQTRIAKVVAGQDGKVVAHTCETLPSSSDCAILANLYGSDGAPGDVLKIVAKGRTGKLNFTEAIREALRSTFSQPISLGGVFVLRQGKANLHVMSDFRKEPRPVDDDDGWLNFFEMSAPLTCLTVFHSRDPGLQLHPDHTHCFSEHGDGGHYHYDTTPAAVEYEAYLNTAKAIYRIDRPEERRS